MYEISFLWIALAAVIIDYIIGEFPGIHPVQLMGNFIKIYEKLFYKNNVANGAILVAVLIIITGVISFGIQYEISNLYNYNMIPDFVRILLIGLLASTGLASKSLKKHVKDVLNASDDEKRAKLSMLVSRNTENFDEQKIYSSLIETYAENLSDGFIAPLFYLLIFGFPGIMIFKAVSTMDSMIGYKNEKYINFGKTAANLDDMLNLIPSRITGLLIWLLSKQKVCWDKWFYDAERYSTSPNAGYPVAAAAYSLGIIVGGTVYYGNEKIDKAEIGEERTFDYKQAVNDFIGIHTTIEALILVFLLIFLSFILFTSLLSF